MHEWTPEAQARLQQYLDAVRRVLPADAGDPDEVASSLAEHLTIEAEQLSAGLVGPEHVERAIRAVGTPYEIGNGWRETAPPSLSAFDAVLAANRAARQAARQTAQTPVRASGGIFVWIFGVILPALAVVFELGTGMMGGLYIDPMPTTALFAVLCGVPIGNVFLLRTLSRGAAAGPRRRAAAFAIAGALIAVTGLYSAVYLPSAPLAVIALLFMGLGILGLSPHLATLAAIVVSRRLFAAWPEGPDNAAARRMYGYGAFAVLGIAAIVAIRIFVLEHGMRLAGGTDPAWQDTGATMLRAMVGRQYVLDRCFQEARLGELLDSPGLRDGSEWRVLATVEEARAAYFTLTGSVFAGEERRSYFSDRFARFGVPPIVNPLRRGFPELEPGRALGVAPGLELAESRLDVRFFTGNDASGGEASAYLEWVLTFANTTAFAQESRTLIHLPPGAAASRLTLWIGGEEREAAFGGRDQVRAAYQDVAVVRRQDPALLTTQGPDRLLLQCFPVPAAGTLKVKIGITAPLPVREGQAWLRLPAIAERNHGIGAAAAHQLWAEGHTPLSSSIAALDTSKESAVYVLRGEAPIEGRGGAWPGWISTPASTAPRRYAAAIGETHASVEIAPAPEAPAATGPVWLVVDAGGGMRATEIDWAGFLGAFPKGIAWHAMLASHEAPSLQTTEPETLARWLEGASYRGGHDPVQTLATAWAEAAATPDGRLIWVHAAYPFARPATAVLEQALQRRPPVDAAGGPRFFDVQVGPGPNRILESLGVVPGMATAPIVNGVDASLRYFAANGRLEDVTRRYAIAEAPGAWPDAAAGSEHLVRLAVLDDVTQRLATANPEAEKAARTLAARMRLVTPVTGAVVLERAEQYQRHGLNPAENQDAVAEIPAIPEPEEWALIAIAACALMLALTRRLRRAPAPARGACA